MDNTPSPASFPLSSPLSSPPAALLVDDPRFDLHRTGALGGYHPERPERLRAVRAAVARSSVRWDRVPAREATAEELARVHDARFVEALEKLRGESGYLDGDTYFGPDSVAAARLAAGGAVDMVDRLIDGDVKQGLALCRPPGHHARPRSAMGFCLLNTVAVAAAHAVARGLSRVLVLDWDVHHGNGTQEMFWKSPCVLYASTHQFPFYPGTGAADESGAGEGQGFTVNVPLSAGGGDEVYRGAFERVLLPVIEAYRPELILVSAGFDASARDPLAQMQLSADAFGWMACALRAAADKSAQGRIALVLEGGYDLVALEAGLVSAVTGLLGTGTSTFDLAKAPAHPDVARAADAAARTWKEVR